MKQSIAITKVLISLFIVFLLPATLKAQSALSKTPVWWYGASSAANFNSNEGSIQQLSNSFIAPKAFTKGQKVGRYGSLLIEYRPTRMWGGSFNVAYYDSKNAPFKKVDLPCGCTADLSTTTSYVTIEPSIRFAPFSFPLYFFAGPRISFNGEHSFTYQETHKADINSDLSAMHTAMYAGQIGTGYDITLSKPNAVTVLALSPFFSYLPGVGSQPRLINNWNINTLRAGLALKFAHRPKADVAETHPVVPVVVPPPVIPEPEIQFSVNAPKAAPVKLEVLETFPLRNYIFINKGSTAIPERYVKLTKNDVVNFKEGLSTLVENETERSAKQLTIYHNILNIIGDRMRSYPETRLTLIGSSVKVNEGRAFAENVKMYLVNIFGIEGSRITTQQRNKPLVPSEHQHGSKQLELIQAEDRRVDLISPSNILLTELDSKTIKPLIQNSIEEDTANRIVLNVNKAEDLLKAWSVDIVDGNGYKQSFGPYTNSMETIPARQVLSNSTDSEGNYHILMLGQTKSGKAVKKDTTIHLLHQQILTKQALRYSILFDFDKSHTVSTYQDFLTYTVAPNIPENATVIIQGHTDIVGNEKHNQTLSDNRAMVVQKVLQNALIKAGKNGIKFNTRGFGQDINQAAFGNALPEERFYNRTVIIDIVPL